MTSDRRDKALETWLRRQQPERSAGVRADCPEPETLAVWIEGGLSDDALDQVVAHAAECERCEAIVATLIRAVSAQPSADPHTRPAVRSWHSRFLWVLPMTAAAAIVALAVWVRTPQPNRVSPPVEPTAARDNASIRPSESQATDGAIGAFPQAELRSRPASAPSMDATEGIDRRALADETRATSAIPKLSEEAPETSFANALPRSATASGSANEERRLTAAQPTDGGASLNADAATPDATRRGPPQSGREASRATTAPAPSTADLARTSRSDGALVWTVLVSAGSTPACRYRGQTIEHSADAGTTWTPVVPESPAALLSGVAVSNDVCWLVGERGTVLRVTRGQLTAVPIPASIELTRISATNSLIAAVTSANGRVFTTSDGGLNWRPQ